VLRARPGVGGVVRGVRQLGSDGQHLAKQRVMWIAVLNPREVTPGHAEAEGASGRGSCGNELRVEAKLGHQLLGAGNGGGHFGLPALAMLAGGDRCRYHTRPFDGARILRPRCEKEMSSYTTSEIRGGMKLLIEGEPFAVIENEFVKPGKGQAFNRIKIRNLKTGRTIERTWRSGESIEAADVQDTEMQYLYQDGDFWHFMVPENFEQYTAAEGRRR